MDLHPDWQVGGDDAPVESEQPEASGRQIQRWSAEETDRLVHIVESGMYGAPAPGVNYPWSKVAVLMPGRSGKQCRERYLNNARNDPKLGGWTAEEQYAVARYHSELGSTWALISQLLPGRSENAVKNHFNALWRSNKLANKRHNLLATYISLVRMGAPARRALEDAQKAVKEHLSELLQGGALHRRARSKSAKEACQVLAAAQALAAADSCSDLQGELVVPGSAIEPQVAKLIASLAAGGSLRVAKRGRAPQSLETDAGACAFAFGGGSGDCGGDADGGCSPQKRGRASASVSVSDGGCTPNPQQQWHHHQSYCEQMLTAQSEPLPQLSGSSGFGACALARVSTSGALPYPGGRDGMPPTSSDTFTAPSMPVPGGVEASPSTPAWSDECRLASTSGPSTALALQATSQSVDLSASLGRPKLEAHWWPSNTVTSGADLPYQRQRPEVAHQHQGLRLQWSELAPAPAPAAVVASSTASHACGPDPFKAMLDSMDLLDECDDLSEGLLPLSDSAEAALAELLAGCNSGMPTRSLELTGASSQGQGQDQAVAPVAASAPLQQPQPQQQHQQQQQPDMLPPLRLDQPPELPQQPWHAPAAAVPAAVLAPAQVQQPAGGACAAGGAPIASFPGRTSEASVPVHVLDAFHDVTTASPGAINVMDRIRTTARLTRAPAPCQPPQLPPQPPPQPPTATLVGAGEQAPTGRQLADGGRPRLRHASASSIWEAPSMDLGSSGPGLLPQLLSLRSSSGGPAPAPLTLADASHLLPHTMCAEARARMQEALVATQQKLDEKLPDSELRSLMESIGLEHEAAGCSSAPQPSEPHLAAQHPRAPQAGQRNEPDPGSHGQPDGSGITAEPSWSAGSWGGHRAHSAEEDATGQEHAVVNGAACTGGGAPFERMHRTAGGALPWQPHPAAAAPGRRLQGRPSWPPAPPPMMGPPGRGWHAYGPPGAWRPQQVAAAPYWDESPPTGYCREVPPSWIWRGPSRPPGLRRSAVPLHAGPAYAMPPARHPAQWPPLLQQQQWEERQQWEGSHVHGAGGR